MRRSAQPDYSSYAREIQQRAERIAEIGRELKDELEAIADSERKR